MRHIASKVTTAIFISLLRPLFGINGNAPICVLAIRGGLGNQLFQISALSYLARNFGCIPLIHDYDLTLSSRDRHQSQFRRLDLSEWFYLGNKLRVPEKYTQKKFLRLAWQFNKRYQLIPTLTDRELTSISTDNQGGAHSGLSMDKPFPLNRQSLNRLFFLNGSFQEPKFAINLPKFNTEKLLRVKPERFRGEIESNSNAVLIHVRLTDFTNNSEEYLRCIQKGLDIIGSNFTSFHWYTDDIGESKIILRQLWGTSKKFFDFPDETMQFDGVALLQKLTTYRNFIPSNSSICWWSFFLAQNFGLNPTIFAEGDRFHEYRFQRLE